MSSDDISSGGADGVPFSLVIGTGALTLILASALAYVMMKTKGNSRGVESEAEVKVEELDEAQYPGGHLSVYFASQTGTSETFGNQLKREGATHGFYVHVIDLEDVALLDVLAEERRNKTAPANAVFLCATYGEGEPTDNSAPFVAELKTLTGYTSTFGLEEETAIENIDPVLKDLNYCVFGLGNRQYEHYNAMGQFFDKTLQLLGATRIAEIGLGDDDNDIEADFENFKDNVMWPTLKKRFIKEGTVVAATNGSKEQLPETPYQVEYLQSNGSNNIKADSYSAQDIHSSTRHYFTSFTCPVTVNRELRSTLDPGSTVHVEIDVSKAKGFHYQTADNLGVLPVNPDHVVESVAKSLGYDLDAVFRLSPSSTNNEWHGAPFPMPLSIRSCLTNYCDLTSGPKRSDLKLLASYAKDPLDQKALLRMASKEGKAEFRQKIMNAHVGLVDLLKLTPSIQAPLEHFLSFCPKLQPRYYTISSSSSVHPKSVHLTVAVTETTKPDGSLYRGICSGHLAEQQTSSGMVRIFNRESTFRLPNDTARPIVMIGPGTGVAPMRALLQEREYQQTKLGKKVGSNILYFGCKTSTMDYLYREEMQEFQSKGILTTLHVAFSREQKDKVYVQHLLAKNATDTWKLMNEDGAYLYVCGGVKMGHDVLETLRDICVKEGALSSDAAKQYMDKLASEGRFVQELWA